MENGYNYEAFQREEENFRAFRTNLPVGSRAPEFVAWDLNGNEVRLSDFRGKKHLVLEFGSIT